MSEGKGAARMTGLVEMDRAMFVEKFGVGPMAVRHSLVDHPLLRLDAIAELADSLPEKSAERHQANHGDPHRGNPQIGP